MTKVGVLGCGDGGGTAIRLPPGFRFHPTDEELVLQYLRRKVLSCPFPVSIIPDIELSRFDPWDLPGGGIAAGGSDDERYFFNLRLTKYGTGNRANRAAGSGYWKATGRDRPVMASRGHQVIGTKKFLVFYRGKPPHGTRTDWIMHEYYLAATGSTSHNCNSLEKKNHSTYIGDWVLCRIFRKKRVDKNDEAEMVVESADREASTGQNRGPIRLIDFLGQRNATADSSLPVTESSCVTEISCESSSEEEGCCNSTTTSNFFPLSRNSRGLSSVQVEIRVKLTLSLNGSFYP